MWLKWMPWKYVFRKAALYHGFADPIAVLSHIRRFSQPSEVNEPIELLRAGVVFHARGLINSRVIQHNMDWIWPYWINKQFSPQSESFIPGAVSFSHVNLTQRNWTAAGLPDYANYPIVDPRGLLTPFWDSWSIDAWLISEDGRMLVPAQMKEVEQTLAMNDGLSIITNSQTEKMFLQTKTEVDCIEDRYLCRLQISCRMNTAGWLVISLRPYNPEGISFIHNIEFFKNDLRWRVNKKYDVFLNLPPDKHIASDYHQGDVSLRLKSIYKDIDKVICNVGMATAAAMYKLEPDIERKIQAAIPLDEKKHKNHSAIGSPQPSHYFGVGVHSNGWKEALGKYCKLNIPSGNFQFLYEAAIRSVVLHSPGEVYPGPFTYKRFWFRDASIIVYAMLLAGLHERAEKLIDKFFAKQTTFGYFHSQQGEWDSNGQVLWLMNKYCSVTGKKPKDSWVSPIINGAKWIIRKRVSSETNSPVTGLLPAGFSAEHLGPNDYYYWDDFWSAAGLYAAGQMLENTEHSLLSQQFKKQGDELVSSIEKSLLTCRQRLGRSAMPASPFRRMDSGAIGSLAACYPTQVFKPSDHRVLDTVSFLMNECIVENGFYHEISHSGINPYLTLHLAQALMRGDDSRFIDLVKAIASLASATGQWPEAVNPRLRSGCMGDGQHVWASAEWIIMMVNSFVLEEERKLILGKGILPQWLVEGTNISIGPVSTSYGPLTVSINRTKDKIIVNWQGEWFETQPEVQVKIPGYKLIAAGAGKTSVELEA